MGVGASKSPGTTGGKDTTLGTADTSSFSEAAPAPAFFFCFFLDDEAEDVADGCWATAAGLLSWVYPYAAAPATTTVTGM